MAKEQKEQPITIMPKRKLEKYLAFALTIETIVLIYLIAQAGKINETLQYILIISGIIYALFIGWNEKPQPDFWALAKQAANRYEAVTHRSLNYIDIRANIGASANDILIRFLIKGIDNRIYPLTARFINNCWLGWIDGELKDEQDSINKNELQKEFAKSLRYQKLDAVALGKLGFENE